MLEFIVGVVTGGVLFGGKKESDAEYKARLAKTDTQRAAATLGKDLSDLPPVIEGTASNVTLDDQAIWAYPFQVVTVGDWKVCLLSDAKVSVGSEIRVVNNSRVRVDGIWHNLSNRTTNSRAMLNRLLSLVGMVVSGVGLWCLWEVLQLTWNGITGSGSGVSIEDAVRWGVGMVVAMMVATLIARIPLGLPGLWKHDDMAI